jgi:hypothetical protein
MFLGMPSSIRHRKSKDAIHEIQQEKLIDNATKLCEKYRHLEKPSHTL